MALAHPLPAPLVELIAQRFRVLGEPMRIKLLDRLREAPATVGQLTVELGSSQQNVSKHLAVLHAAGVVSREKDGTSVRYAIADDTIFEICDIVCGGIRRQFDELNGVLQGSDA